MTQFPTCPECECELSAELLGFMYTTGLRKNSGTDNCEECGCEFRFRRDTVTYYTIEEVTE